MKKLIAFGMIATSLSFADITTPQNEVEAENVKNSCGYVSLGLGPFPIPLPLIGIGGRFQNGHHGADISLQGITFGRGFTVLKENVDYLYYFKPKLASQFYMGYGVSMTETISHKRCHTFLSPQILVGKQYSNENNSVRFFQAQIEPLFFGVNKKHSCQILPVVVLSYGICF